MSIDNKNIGKHGTLTLGDAKILGTLKKVRRDSFHFLIDNTRVDNGFLLDDAWKFEPDPEPVVFTPGDVIEFTDIENTFYIVQADGSYHFVSFSPGTRSGKPTLSENEVRQSLKTGRVRFIHQQNKEV